MGLIKGGFFVFTATLLLFSLLAMNLSWTISSSLNIENLKSEAVSNSDLINKETGVLDFLIENEETIINHCENNSEYVSSNAGYTSKISCDSIKNDFSSAEDAIIEQVIEDVYYKDYECNFWECFLNFDNPLYLISEHAKNYWDSKFYYFLLASLALAGGALFFAEKKTTGTIILGSLLIVSSLPFFKLNLMLPSEKGLFTLALNLISSSAVYIAIAVFLIGAFILSFGVGLKFWNLSKFFSRYFGKNNQ